MSLNAPRLTPCIGKCTTTTGDAVCKGCGRTLEHIRDWNTYSPEVKAEIMRELSKTHISPKNRQK